MGYPSDISREEYALVREFLEGVRKKTKPRKLDLYWQAPKQVRGRRVTKSHFTASLNLS